MSQSKYAGTGELSLFHLLSDPVYQTIAVPKFQRDYEWTANIIQRRSEYFSELSKEIWDI